MYAGHRECKVYKCIHNTARTDHNPKRAVCRLDNPRMIEEENYYYCMDELSLRDILPENLDPDVKDYIYKKKKRAYNHIR